jgi:hypothetical protein
MSMSMSMSMSMLMSSCVCRCRCRGACVPAIVPLWSLPSHHPFSRRCAMRCGCGDCRSSTATTFECDRRSLVDPSDCRRLAARATSTQRCGNEPVIDALSRCTLPVPCSSSVTHFRYLAVLVLVPLHISSCPCSYLVISLSVPRHVSPSLTLTVAHSAGCRTTLRAWRASRATR